MFIMANEPLKDISPSEFAAYFADKCTPSDLAEAYALSSNKFWWVEDNEYDFDVGTPEHSAARTVTDTWHHLMDHYKEQIFAILHSEGVAIPSTGQIAVLIPFMRKYGYEDRGGWWFKEPR